MGQVPCDRMMMLREVKLLKVAATHQAGLCSVPPGYASQDVCLLMLLLLLMPSAWRGGGAH